MWPYPRVSCNFLSTRFMMSFCTGTITPWDSDASACFFSFLRALSEATSKESAGRLACGAEGCGGWALLPRSLTAQYVSVKKIILSKLGRLLPNAQNQSPPLIYISSSVSVFVSYLLHYKMDQNGDNYSKIFKYRSFYILYRTISRHFCPGNILYLIASRHFCPAIVVSISYIVQSQDISALEISFILASRHFCPAVFEYRKEEPNTCPRASRVPGA